MSEPRAELADVSAPSTGSDATSSGHATRQQVLHCPYCAEETLFPIEDHGWECRSCGRAFSVKFLGLRTGGGSGR